MIPTSLISPLRRRQVDYADTERLKAKLRRLRRERRPFHLTAADFEEILRWKFGRRAARLRSRRAANTGRVIRAVTGAALSLSHPDEEYEQELRLRLLCSMRGVSVMVASAILALSFPDRYAVIDFRVWRQLFGEQRYHFTASHYRRYMRAMRPLAKRLGWPVQEVDHAIWEYDRRRSGAPWP
jgi:thermostable 8-oxoguanine DNA glycosylase